jgi:Dyp-type peroxidase family
MVSLELIDIQGNILRGYNPVRGRHVFLTVEDVDKAREFLAKLADGVQNAKKWKDGAKPPVAVNVALTYRGLEALEVDGDMLRELPDEFIEPVRRRAKKALGDDVVNWWSDPYRQEADRQHILLLIYELPQDGVAAQTDTPYAELAAAAPGDKLAAVADPLVAEALASGLDEVHTEYVEAVKDQREHFGFADGYGQPAVEGAPGPKVAGQGVPHAEHALWTDLKAGEFIHGYPDEDGFVVSNEAAPLLRNGSFMVYRKLEQDVDEFNRLLDEEAVRYKAWTSASEDFDMTRELVAAKLVGRWRDGVAIELKARRDDKPAAEIAQGAATPRSNNFRYAHDPDGYRCPIGAHVRRTNPRDEDGHGGVIAKRHRIIRRSMPYGPPYAKDDHEERGLIFICFNASIKRQFETVQSQWCMDGNAFGLGSDQDWLLSTGKGTKKATIQGAPPYFADASKRIVTPRGCQYLLMPGIGALRAIAAGLW